MSEANNILGQTFKIDEDVFTFISEISVNRTNADIYLCANSKGNYFVAKYFCKRTPVSVVGLSVYNHFGRARDGSHKIFHEIKSKSEKYEFIIDHYGRTKFRDNWLILIEYIEGKNLYSFIEDNYKESFSLVINAVNALAETLSEWHNNGFAHGDPHLENAILHIDGNGSYKVKLIDYGQIHHKDFQHCNKYQCFSSDPLLRIYEDFENDSKKIANGFVHGLYRVQEEFGMDNILVETFNTQYTELSKDKILLK